MTTWSPEGWVTIAGRVIRDSTRMLRPDVAQGEGADLTVRPRLDFALEVLGRLKGPVDEGESQVSDLIEFAEWTEDGQPDLIAGHLEPLGAYRVLHLLGEQVQGVIVDLRPGKAGVLR